MIRFLLVWTLSSVMITPLLSQDLETVNESSIEGWVPFQKTINGETHFYVPPYGEHVLTFVKMSPLSFYNDDYQFLIAKFDKESKQFVFKDDNARVKNVIAWIRLTAPPESFAGW